MSQLLETSLSKFKKVPVWDNAAVKKCLAHQTQRRHLRNMAKSAFCHKIEYSGIKYVVVCSSWNELFDVQVHDFFISDVDVSFPHFFVRIKRVRLKTVCGRFFVSRRFHIVDACWSVVHLAGCCCFSLPAPHSLQTCMRKHVFARTRNGSAAYSVI